MTFTLIGNYSENIENGLCGCGSELDKAESVYCRGCRQTYLNERKNEREETLAESFEESLERQSDYYLRSKTARVLEGFRTVCGSLQKAADDPDESGLFRDSGSLYSLSPRDGREDVTRRDGGNR